MAGLFKKLIFSFWEKTNQYWTFEKEKKTDIGLKPTKLAKSNRI